MARGLLTADTVAGDQRAIRLQLTDEGRLLLSQTEAAMAARLKDVVRATDDPAMTIRALAMLDEAIDRHLAERRAAAGGK